MIVAGALLTMGFGLMGCSNEAGDSDTAAADKPISKQYKGSPKERMDYKTAQKRFGDKVHKLSFFEQRITSDSDRAYYTLAYYDGPYVKYKGLTDSDNFSEIIDPKVGTTPYVITPLVDDGYYYIHRSPYQTFNQAPVSGKVTGKEVIK